MYQILKITTKNQTYHIQNLDESKDYYFIMNAINYAGKGENSTEIRVSLRMYHGSPLPATNQNALAIALPVTFTCLVILGLIALVAVIIVLRAKIRGTKSIIFSIQRDEENYKESEDEERKEKRNGLFEEELELEEISKNHEESEDIIKNGKLEFFVEEKVELEETSESYEKNEDEEKKVDQKGLFEEELELEEMSENKKKSEDEGSNEKLEVSVEEKVEFEETLENHDKSEDEEKERKQKGFVEEKVEMYEEISMRNK
ncbi:PREDICTED: myb-like protein X [Amphimedon queenslandica]|uniref:Fibronectin type-III domain-containing protein n=1 Tax=Amphimedon queenslandica TaxID=400682 RepID=A0AAN0JTZ0_AMPQE|nr:PREDICTED: myb-like protein X [Amphimedon queenslandica]|eukprot:XP_019860514.1 PREDICTED: myb-like protein X [Amphimedon queenslandica]